MPSNRIDHVPAISRARNILSVPLLCLMCLMMPHSAAASFFGEYWNVAVGPSPAIPGGAANLTRTDNSIDFDWGESSPQPGSINANGFVARWTTTVGFSAGRYRFTTTTDDGVRVKLDGTAIIDHWIDQGSTTYTVDADVTAGSHGIVVEYYENGGGAVARFSYEYLSPAAQSFAPADGAAGVGLNDNLVLTLDKNVSAVSAASGIVLYDGDGMAVETINPADTGRVGIVGGVVTINPASTLAEMADYHVRISPGVFCAGAGVCYAGIGDDTTWNFTTGDFTKPATADDYAAKDAQWQQADQTITLTPSDPGNGSGVAWTRYCIDDGVSACVPAAGTTLAAPYEVTIVSEGTTYLRYASQDASGNRQDAVTRTVRLDKTAPAVSVGETEDSSVAIGRTAVVTDALSGTDAATYHWYKVSGPGSISFSDEGALSTMISADRAGAYVIGFSVSDRAGNAGSDTFTWRKSDGVGLPKEAFAAPSVPAGGFFVTLAGGAPVTRSRYVALASHAGGDVTRMAISADGDFREASLEEYRAEKIWDLCAGSAACAPGEYQVFVKFYTAWGRSTPMISASIRLEAGAPLAEEVATAGPVRYVFLRQLRFGMSGEDVRELQKLLNRHGFLLAGTGAGACGQETPYFGILTGKAVAALQRAYGLAPFPGYVGPLTLELLNRL